ncbi:IucA/IucC family siderophore biosynthesis protein [Paludibacterium sp. B53371]|uniref:IucA/IucC family protein n=1 Tax=Paludibacterium sp. B53371 TaxID=2806263 RepID=UPI001C04E6A2|nr:IucA/IucC family siderophore biosynthesis protein [Paludibacterium sp. B53371]
MNAPIASSATAVAHLRPERWQRANRHLLAKAIGEFSHELLLTPQRQPDGRYVIETTGPRYLFAAERSALDHWQVDPDSLVCLADGQEVAPDMLAFIVAAHEQLGLSQSVLPDYLDEISSTLFGCAWKLHQPYLSAEALALADYQALESGMTEGHPAFVANNGRIGFSLSDYRRYAPECGQPFALVWLAVNKQVAELSLVENLSASQLYAEELGGETLARFAALLRDRGLSPDDFWYLPAHPWQWQQRLAVCFAAEIAAQRLVYLGESEDRYAAQQSIRTMFNVSQPEKRYVKTALSILNMGFMRGLSPYYMAGTPAINQWVAALVRADETLRDCGFDVLCEVAAIGYRQPYYEAALQGNGPHKKQLAALWRESPMSRLRPGERLMTMAALLHVDGDGHALLPALIRASGLTAGQWLQHYLRAYLRPLLHCFYCYDLVFMPHGENLILILDGHVPVRVLMKDIGEEVGVLNPAQPLPGFLERICAPCPDELRTLSILTDVFDGFLRFLGPILQRAGLAEAEFWRSVAQCVTDYQQDHPERADKYVRFDLFAPDFIRSCLNRLQLANNRQMVNLADPVQGLQFHGRLNNPIAAYRPGAAS